MRPRGDRRGPGRERPRRDHRADQQRGLAHGSGERRRPSLFVGSSGPSAVSGYPDLTVPAGYVGHTADRRLVHRDPWDEGAADRLRVRLRAGVAGSRAAVVPAVDRRHGARARAPRPPRDRPGGPRAAIGAHAASLSAPGSRRGATPRRAARTQEPDPAYLTGSDPVAIDHACIRLSPAAGEVSELATAPIILVPGFWLGAWAWDEVASLLRADGHDVTALTLPGLESKDADRSSITLQRPRRRDRAPRSRRRTPRSSSPSTARPASRGYAASDRVPERIAAMVYVDTAPGKAPLDPGVRGRREADGVGGDPGRGEPGRADRRAARHLPRAGRPGAGGPDPRRGTSSPTTPAATSRRRSSRPATPPRPTSSTPERTRCRRSSPACPELRNITWIDLPTSHWPMWSRPADIARIIGDVARGASRP